MTKQNEVLNNENYTPLLNEGFVGLIDTMGNDSSIVQAARVSYGDGTKKVSEDRGLIRYLMRHRHTTPNEMVEFKFHCKMPIFVARQWIRHRTASVNEYSGRYSIMVDEFYIPELKHILPQSTNNKQGRGGEMSEEDRLAIQNNIKSANEKCYAQYQNLLGNNSTDEHGAPWNDVEDYSDMFDGISREMARGVLSVNNYTEWYWKVNLHNLFHFLSLRMDSHAQYEIRVFANAMYEQIKSYVPFASEAFEDYRLNAANVSRMEIELLKAIMHGGYSWEDLQIEYGGDKEVGKQFGLSIREMDEFKEKFNLS